MWRGGFWRGFLKRETCCYPAVLKLGSGQVLFTFIGAKAALVWWRHCGRGRWIFGFDPDRARCEQFRDDSGPAKSDIIQMVQIYLYPKICFLLYNNDFRNIYQFMFCTKGIRQLHPSSLSLPPSVLIARNKTIKLLMHHL